MSNINIKNLLEQINKIVVENGFERVEDFFKTALNSGLLDNEIHKELENKPYFTKNGLIFKQNEDNKTLTLIGVNEVVFPLVVDNYLVTHIQGKQFNIKEPFLIDNLYSNYKLFSINKPLENAPIPEGFVPLEHVRDYLHDYYEDDYEDDDYESFHQSYFEGNDFDNEYVYDDFVRQKRNEIAHLNQEDLNNIILLDQELNLRLIDIKKDEQSPIHIYDFQVDLILVELEVRQRTYEEAIANINELLIDDKKIKNEEQFKLFEQIKNDYQLILDKLNKSINYFEDLK